MIGCEKTFEREFQLVGHRQFRPLFRPDFNGVAAGAALELKATPLRPRNFSVDRRAGIGGTETDSGAMSSELKQRRTECLCRAEAQHPKYGDESHLFSLSCFMLKRIGTMM